MDNASTYLGMYVHTAGAARDRTLCTMYVIVYIAVTLGWLVWVLLRSFPR